MQTQVKTQVRILLAAAALALLAGFLGLRAGNASLEARIEANSEPPGAERPGAKAAR